MTRKRGRANMREFMGTALLTALILLGLGSPQPASAQGDASARGTADRQGAGQDTIVYRLNAIVLTATRSPREVFATPAPVAVIDLTDLPGTKPNTVTDLFRALPGVDVAGVGVQQPRPIIRGQRGQRILLLQDGVRLNNSRRQQDFGGLPALADVSSIGRVEVVRGPASVLYGTDAIGGVINIISRDVERDGVHGTLSYLYGGEEEQHRGSGAIFGRRGAFDFQASLAKREASDYTAPDGRFGELELAEPAVVHGTGVRDESARIRLGYDLSERHGLFTRAEYYAADDAGFGFVEPDDYAPELPRIDIQYPKQRFRRLTVGYEGTNLASTFADGLDVTAYVQDNVRDLNFDLFSSFGPQAPPGAGIQINTFNHTDLTTTGFRIEAQKLASDRVRLTYGVDFFRDDSENSDSSETAVIGFGPPMVDVSNTPLVPAATYRSIGTFLQAETEFTRRLTLIAGARVQDVRAETTPAPSLDESFESKTNRTLVGAFNALYALSDNLTVIGSVGRAFRSPNLIEWFFDGPTPEGDGYQVRSPDLEPETSVNVDLGIRYRSDFTPGVLGGAPIGLDFEAFVFRNEVRNGIRIAPLGTQVNGLDAFQNVNVDELVYRGVEVSAGATLPAHLNVSGNYSYLDSQDKLDPSNPVGESFSSKVGGALRYTHPSDRAWLEYAVRHNGERKDAALGDSPIGDALPAFTVHDLRAGLTLFRRGEHAHRIAITLRNLTDELYAEFSNVSFFRPEPRRSLTVSWEMAF